VQETLRYEQARFNQDIPEPIEIEVEEFEQRVCPCDEGACIAL